MGPLRPALEGGMEGNRRSQSPASAGRPLHLRMARRRFGRHCRRTSKTQGPGPLLPSGSPARRHRRPRPPGNHPPRPTAQPNPLGNHRSSRLGHRKSRRSLPDRQLAAGMGNSPAGPGIGRTHPLRRPRGNRQPPPAVRRVHRCGRPHGKVHPRHRPAGRPHTVEPRRGRCPPRL